MANNVISAIPAFTQDDAPSNVNQVVPEVKPADSPAEEEIPAVEEPVVEEKETPAEPLPAANEPAVPAKVPNSEDIEKLNKVVAGLQFEATKLRKDIVELRGQKREVKEQQLAKVQEQIEKLEGVHPDDVAIVEKIIRAKGYVTKDEQQKMFYDSVKNEKVTQFLEKFPEYKPENDPNDARWSALQAEMAYYRMPDDPHKVYDLLEKAHRATSTAVAPNERITPVKKEQARIAGVGAGGAQRSSPIKALDPEKRFMLKQGGWSEEEIKQIERKIA